MAIYEFWYTDPEGTRLELLDTMVSAQIALVYGDVGAAVFALPFDGGRIYNETAPDRRIHVYRAPDGGALELLAVCFGRQWTHKTNNNGMTTLELGAFDQNDLLRRRIVAYAADTAQASKSDLADDMMKEIIAENLGASATDTDRDVTGLGFSIQSDLGDGPSLGKAFSWRNMLTVLQDIQASSKAAGTEVFFAVRPNTPTSLEFQTFTGQPGADRTVTTGVNPLVFGLEYGNLSNPQYREDYGAEQNYIYAGGQGKGSERNVQEVSDSGRINQSVWNRREGFRDARQVKTDAAVTSAGQSQLSQKRPQFYFSGKINATPDTPFGGMAGWREGDRVTVTYSGRQFDAIIRSVLVQVDGSGREAVTARVENVTT